MTVKIITTPISNNSPERLNENSPNLTNKINIFYGDEYTI